MTSERLQTPELYDVSALFAVVGGQWRLADVLPNFRKPSRILISFFTIFDLGKIEARHRLPEPGALLTGRPDEGGDIFSPVKSVGRVCAPPPRWRLEFGEVPLQHSFQPNPV